MPALGGQAEYYLRSEKKEEGRGMREDKERKIQECVEKANERHLEIIYAFVLSLTRED